MSFKLVKYKQPDFSQSQFTDAPDAVTAPAPKDKVAPEHYHATTIFPEYFKVKGQWLLAEESRMDCVAVYENGKIYVREFRYLKQGDLVFTGRTENCEDGIFVYPHGFDEGEGGHDEAFAFRQRRSGRRPFPRIMITFMSCFAMRGNTDMWFGSWDLPVLLIPIPGKPFQNW